MGRNKTYDRKLVIEKAMKLFWKKGYEGAHLSELVKVTGLNRFSLYKEFGGKEGLFHESLSFYLKESDTHYAKTLSKKPYGLKNIEDYFNNISFDSNYHGCFFVHTLSERHVTPNNSYKLAKRFSKKIETLYLNNIKAAQKAGDIKTSLESKALAQYFTMTDLGLSIFGVSHGKSKSLATVIKTTLLPLKR